MAPAQSFRPHEHLRRPADFKRVYARKRSVSDSFLIVYACENGLGYNRLGLSVSRKVGSAVIRNRIRRLFREAYRLSKTDLPGGMDLVLIPRQGAEIELSKLLEALPRLVRQVSKRLSKQ
ncbi:MAG: ribonuclease P protein component [Gemmataceae bacterium]